MKARLRLAIGLVIAAGALWLAFQNVRAEDLTRAMARTQPLWLIAAVASIFLTVSLVVTRFRVFVSAWTTAPPWGRLWHVTIIGQVANIVVPFQLGDGAKVVAGTRAFDLPMSVLAAIVVVERAFDLLALSVIAGLLLLSGAVPGWAYSGVMVVMGVGPAVLIAIAVARAAASRDAALPYAERRGIVGWIAREVLLLQDGLDHVNRPAMLSRIAAVSLAIAAGSIFTNLLVMRALDLPVPAEAAALLWVVLQCGGIVLPAPDGIGTSQLLAIATLNLWGVPAADALACSITLYLVVRLPKIAMFPRAMSVMVRPSLPTSAKA